MTTISYAHEVQEDFNLGDIPTIFANREKGSGRKDVLQSFVIQHCLRRMLPYGKWTCADGREVIFNREYQPIFQRQNGVALRADPAEWVKDILSAEMYYDDLTSPLRIADPSYDAPSSQAERRACKRALLICLKVLREFVVPERKGSVNRQWSIEDL